MADEFVITITCENGRKVHAKATINGLNPNDDAVAETIMDQGNIGSLMFVEAWTKVLQVHEEYAEFERVAKENPELIKTLTDALEALKDEKEASGE